MHPSHKLKTSAECNCKNTSREGMCNICDGGLAYCVVCRGGESDLDVPCQERVRRQSIEVRVSPAETAIMVPTHPPVWDLSVRWPRPRP